MQFARETKLMWLVGVGESLRVGKDLREEVFICKWLINLDLLLDEFVFSWAIALFFYISKCHWLFLCWSYDWNCCFLDGRGCERPGLHLCNVDLRSLSIYKG